MSLFFAARDIAQLPALLAALSRTPFAVVSVAGVILMTLLAPGTFAFLLLLLQLFFFLVIDVARSAKGKNWATEN